MSRLLDEALREERSDARAEALEEAARRLERLDCPRLAVDIRTLITTPAPASIPVERVREVLRKMRNHPTSWDRTTCEEVAERLDVPLDGRQGAEGHAGRELIRSMVVNPDAVDPSCECGEVLSAHRSGGRRGIDETDPPYRTLCVGFRKATRHERTLVRCLACGGSGGTDGTCRDCGGTGMVAS